MILKLKMENFSKVNPMKFKSARHHSPLYFVHFEEVLVSSLMKILEWHKVSELQFFFQIEFKSFSKTPFYIFKWKRSYYLHSRVLWWNEFEFMEIKMKMKVLGKSFYSLSFNFQKVSISTQFHTINHTKKSNKQSQLFI